MLACLLTSVLALGVLALPATAAADPHGAYSDSTAKCALCHAPHEAAGPSIVTSSTVTGLCVTCHDGSQASNIAAQFGIGDASIVTTHPLGGSAIPSCATCHTPHRGPAEGNPMALSVGPARASTGTAVCGGCHGSGSTLPGGDYVARFTGTAHDTTAATLPASGSGIRCATCHEPHGSAYPAMTIAAETSTCFGAGRSLSCHNSAASADGVNISVVTTASASPTAHHDLLPAQQAASGSNLKCSDCHNPHTETGSARSSNPDSIGTTVTSGADAYMDASGRVYVAIGAEHDGVAPVISNLQIVPPSTQPTLTWTTDETATTWLDWGTTTSYEMGSYGADLPLVTSHAVKTPLLTPGQTYHYRLRSADAVGNERVSVDGVYTVLSPPTAPASVSPPTYSTSVYGPTTASVAVSWGAGTAGDADPLQYQVYLDGVGQGWQSGLGTTLGIATVGVQGVTNHQWYVVARDSIHQYSVSGSSPTGAIALTDLTDYSCPILYTWDGSRFTYVTDVMGRGVLGIQVARGTYRYPPSVEDSRIDASQLKAKDGRYEIRLKNEKDEIEFVDEVKLRAVDHPAGTSVYVDDLTRTFDTRSLAGAKVYTVRDPKPVRATYDNVVLYKGQPVSGRDISGEVAKADGEFAPASLFDDNRYTFDLGKLQGARNIKLIVRGWSQYASPQERAAWLQAGARPAPMALEVADARGAWVTVDEDLSFIPGYDKTVVFDLSGKFPAGVTDYKVRMRGLTRTWFDWVAVDTSAPEPVTVTEIGASSADLAFKGVAAKGSGAYPSWDYDKSSGAAARTHDGAFTRYGDVLELLSTSDDRFTVMDTGDEIAISFPERPVPSGMERTYVIHSDGYFQELTGKVDPMPFHGMSNYPYGAEEHYPDDALHTEYLRTYQTRVHVSTASGQAALEYFVGRVRSAISSAQTALCDSRDARDLIVAGWTRQVPPPGAHFSVNSDQLIVKSLGLGRGPIQYAAAAAWEDAGTSVPPAPATGTPVSAPRLSYLTALDTTYMVTGLATADRAWNWQVVRFDLGAAGRNRVSELRVLWRGYGEPTAGYATRILLYNRVTASWDSTVTRTGAGVPFSAVIAKTSVPNAACLPCHDGTPPAGVTVPSSVANIGATWLTSAFHGPVAVGSGNNQSGVFTADTFIGQFAAGQAPNIQCATCHDPHGTSNLYHIPSAVADTTGLSVTGSAQAAALCSSCHLGNANDWHNGCTGCHHPGYYTGSPGYYNHGPQVWTGSDCLGCHGHGRVFDHKQTPYYIETQANGTCHESAGGGCVPEPYNTF